MDRLTKLKYLPFLLWVIVLSLFAELGAYFYLKNNPHLDSAYLVEYNKVIKDNAELLNRDPQKRGITILFFGGSTMEGFPFYPAVTLVKWMKNFFDFLYPETKVNLVNFGEGGENSVYIEHAITKTIAYKPDIVIILFGHNEFLRNISLRNRPIRGFLISKSAFINLIHIALSSYKEKMKLKEFKQKVVQNITGTDLSDKGLNSEKKVRTKEKTKKEGGEKDNSSETKKLVSQEVPSQSQEVKFFYPIDENEKWVILGSPGMKKRLSGLKKRLIHIIDMCRQNNITLLVATPPSNMKFAALSHPISLKGQKLDKWIYHAQKGVLLFNHWKFQEALNEFLAAYKLDDTNALLLSYIARTYERLGDFTKAEEFYYKTSRHDIRRNKIFSDVEKVIRETCHKENIPYINIHDFFVSLSKNRIVGNEYIIDNVHPTLEGQYLLAQSLLQFILETTSFFPNRELIFPDYHSIIEKFSLQKDFHYVTNKHLGDYYSNHFDESFSYYQKAYQALPTQEICMRIIQLCMRYGKYEQAKPCIEKLMDIKTNMDIKTKGHKLRIPNG